MTMQLQAADKTDERAVLAAMSTEQLREEFKRGLRLTADHLTRMALIVRELESRGESLTHVENGLLKLLRSISFGTLLPEVVARFATSPQKMRRIASLPVEKQKLILDDESKVEEILPPRVYRRSTPSSELNIEMSRENPIQAARLATPRDLAETIAQMIDFHPEPKEVWQSVCGQPAIRRLAESKPGANGTPLTKQQMVELIIEEVEALVPHRADPKLTGRLSYLAVVIQKFFDRAEKSTY